MRPVAPGPAREVEKTVQVDITPNSFHWIGESLDPDGVTWRVNGEFIGRRVR